MDSEQKNPPDEQPKQGHLSFLKVLLCAADWSFLPLVEYIEGEWGTIKVFWKEARGHQIERLEDRSFQNQQESFNKLSEAKRANDVLQQRLEFFQSLPEKVLTLYTNLSNLYANDPTNRQQMMYLFNQVGSLASNVDTSVSASMPKLGLLRKNGHSDKVFFMVSSGRI